MVSPIPNQTTALVIVGVLAILMCAAPTSASSSTTEIATTESSTETTTTMASTTTTTPFTISCYSGFCSGIGCTVNITSKCSTTSLCKMKKEENATDITFSLSCGSAPCSVIEYCCTQNDCNRDERVFDNGGQALSSWIGNILVIFATMFVTRQTTIVGY